MELITMTSAFTEIVGLIVQFRNERGEAKKIEFDDFLTWLIEKNHEELKTLIEHNLKASIGVKALLHEQQVVLISRLESIDQALVNFASFFDGFSDLGQGLKLGGGLSEQAIDILKQFDESGASRIMEARGMSESCYLYADGNNQGTLNVSDTRFVEDDIKTLVELGLLRHEYSARGDNNYLFTRQAAELVKNLTPSES